MSEPDDDALRRQRTERRREGQDAEHLTVTDQWTRRTLGDVAADAMRRGDRVRVTVPGEHFIGDLIDVGVDYATVADTARGHVDLHLAASLRTATAGAHYQGPPVMLEIVTRTRHGGHAGSGAPPTFRGRLSDWVVRQQLEPRRRVHIGTVLRPDPLQGRLRLRAADHLHLSAADGTEAFVPLAVVTFISWAPVER